MGGDDTEHHDGAGEGPGRGNGERDEATELAEAITDLVTGVTPPFDQPTVGSGRQRSATDRSGERHDTGEDGGQRTRETGASAERGGTSTHGTRQGSGKTDGETPVAVAADVVRAVDDLLTEVTPPAGSEPAAGRAGPGQSGPDRGGPGASAPDGAGPDATRMVEAINDMVAGVVPPATGDSAAARSDAERAAGLVGMLDGLLTGVAAPSVEVVANRLHALEGVRLELASVTGVVHVEVESVRQAVHVVRHQQAAVRQLDEMLAAGGFTGQVRVDGVQVGRLGVEADPGRLSRWLADGRTEVRVRGLLSAVAAGLRPNRSYKSLLPN